MKLSNKSRYGLRALVDLAVNSKDGHVALNLIAERNGISPQYLEQVFASLRKAGIVKSIKGPQGGYFLAREADQITAADILEALEGTYYLEEENISEIPAQTGISVAIQELLINRINHEMDILLNDINLADLENYYMEHKLISDDMYYI
ncbi:MAG: Rrf2 family transcriptional regulator [Eubacterium sp.]|nr:Rrf2 family transcriptional regulator [Eubacterium sp.]